MTWSRACIAVLLLGAACASEAVDLRTEWRSVAEAETVRLTARLQAPVTATDPTLRIQVEHHRAVRAWIEERSGGLTHRRLDPEQPQWADARAADCAVRVEALVGESVVWSFPADPGNQLRPTSDGTLTVGLLAAGKPILSVPEPAPIRFRVIVDGQNLLECPVADSIVQQWSP